MYNYLFSWIISVWVNIAVSYKVYQHWIPNGERVPDPCHPDQIWEAVGHKNKEGAGQRNPFGIDFERFGKKWTKDLCLLDSDGDGRTNGEELGDPNCTWTGSSTLNVSSDNITHPGICEPLDSVACRQQTTWFSCMTPCPPQQENETRNVSIKFPRTKVPNHVTTYMCLIFEFPQDGDYHVVATKPVIDNYHVMHHMLLFGCDEDGEIKQEIDTPFPCGMIADPKCSSVIGLWSLGISGQCSHNSSGFRIGQNGFKKGALQIHWNNPTRQERMTDSSGMIIFFTPVLRPNDAGILIVGQYWLDLSPRQQNVLVTTECSSECSQKLLKDEIFITAGYNHMHYLGREERIELYRNGVKLTDITYDRNYSYDSPVLHSFQEPVRVIPGDLIMTSCKYSTVSRSENVKFGDSTSDEMCLGFLTYFPKKNLKDSYCTNWKSIPLCLLWNENSDTVVKGCSIQKLLQGRDETANPIIQNIIHACSPVKVCSDWCRHSVNIARFHPCFHGDVLDFIGYESLHDFPDFLIPFIVCDFKTGVNFSTEIVFENTKTNIRNIQYRNISVKCKALDHILLFFILMLKIIDFIIYLRVSNRCIFSIHGLSFSIRDVINRLCNYCCPVVFCLSGLINLAKLYMSFIQ